MTKDDAVMLAVAMGTDAATAKARLDAAYPDPPAPVKNPDDVIVVARERRGGDIVTTHMLRDGSQVEVAREAVPLPAGTVMGTPVGNNS